MMSFLASSQVLFNRELISDKGTKELAEAQLQVRGHQLPGSAFQLRFLCVMMYEGKVCLYPGKHGICVYCSRMTSSSEVLIDKQLFSGKDEKDTESHLISHWCSPPLLPFPCSLCLNPSGIWITCSCAFCTLKSSITTVYTAQNQAQVCNVEINHVLWHHCLEWTEGWTQSKLTWDLGTQSLLTIWSNWRNCPVDWGWFVSVFYTVFLYYQRAPTTFLCRMYYRWLPDRWLICCNEASPTCFWRKENSMVPKCSQLAVYVFSSCCDQLPSQTVVREQKTEDLLSFHHMKMYSHIMSTVGGLTGQLVALTIPRGTEYRIA